MSAITDMHERLNAIRLRGHTPREYPLDHEEWVRLWLALQPILGGGVNGDPWPENPGRFDQMFFEGVRIVNLG